ncbi:ATP-binding cassette domain-containing protein [Litorivicinus lipolyticus]|uniref:ATP-binding cassette domain-containing protein n=1 Tax=Litorivicinus lipolyticus TaxID=418701 RepID=A0A5Q2QGF5_9GAMM|nr:ATP-binding cassette domain-containing protein [Litorivicinus lipolyticus]QGG80085.1 ATP-binding cassette domain-containing protein [Litorivicinus lipolyticus]
MSLVQVSNLNKTFDQSQPAWLRAITRAPVRQVKAVQSVSFTIDAGQTFALVGESGSGKSTLARAVVGLEAADSGQVLFDGQAVTPQAPMALRRQIQMVFQSPYASLNPRWRVGDIIAEPLTVFGLATARGAVQTRVAELLVKVGLSASDGARYPHEFSGGQRQRISIARALASEPRFIVCDEPTSALDVSVQAQVLNLLKQLQRDLGLTYLFITHDLAVVRTMAHRIGVMRQGAWVEEQSADALFASPQDPYTQMLLTSAPVIR